MVSNLRYSFRNLFTDLIKWVFTKVLPVACKDAFTSWITKDAQNNVLKSAASKQQCFTSTFKKGKVFSVAEPKKEYDIIDSKVWIKYW